MRRLAFLVFLAGAASTPLAAQSSIEFTPTIGFRYGGTVNSDGGHFAATSGVAWGGTIGFRVKRDGLVEVVYSRQSTTIQFNPDAAARFDVGKASIEYYQIGGALEFGHNENTKPFFALTVGGTRFAPQSTALGDDWRFSFGAALGLKTYLNQHIGLRAQARLWMSALSSDTQFWCTLPGSCVIVASNGVFFAQGEFSGGVIFVF